MDKTKTTIARIFSILLLICIVFIARDWYINRNEDINRLRSKIAKGINQDELQSLLDDEAFYNNWEAANYLLSHGAKVDVYSAAAFGDINYLKGKPDSYFQKNKYFSFGDTPIHVALANGQIEVAKILIDKGLSINELSEFDKRTPLMRAIEQGNTDSVKFILEHKCNINLKKEDGKSALIMSQDAEISELLLKNGANINATDKLKRTALHWAVDHGQEDIVRVLLKYHPNLKLKDISNETPLAIAIKDKNINIIKLLSRT